MISDRMDINRVLTEMRAIKAQTQALQPQEIDKNVSLGRQSLSVDGIKPTSETSSFGQLMNQAVNQVNDLQKASGSMAKAYEQGQPGVDVTDVMIASQKAGVSFQAMLQVRNKLAEAYRDVMNMPV